MNKTFMRKADNFKYPTLEERKRATQAWNSEVKAFEFNAPKFSSLFPEIVKGNFPVDEASKLTSLKAWDLILRNRIGKLYETFIRLSVYYKRYKVLNTEGTDDEEHTAQLFQFEYYSEVYYYLLHSLKDTLAQILNVFYDMKITEHTVQFDAKFIKAVSNPSLRTFLSIYFKSTSSKESAECRNSLAHRFPFNAYDNRMLITENSKGKFLNIFMKRPAPNEQIFEDIKIVLKELGELFVRLHKEFKN